MSPVVVLDASVALALFFPDERDIFADSVYLALGEDRAAAIPALFHLEVANALRRAIRDGRVPQEAVQYFGNLLVSRV